MGRKDLRGRPSASPLASTVRLPVWALIAGACLVLIIPVYVMFFPQSPPAVQLVMPENIPRPYYISPKITVEELTRHQEFDAAIVKNYERTLVEMPLKRSATNPLCYEFPNKRCAPYFFILGALKCGTTSLYAYLSKHPNVTVLQPSEAKAAVRVKEPGYFNKPQNYADHSLDRYLPNFPIVHANDWKVTGEASPGYIYSSTAAPFLTGVMPHARMVMIMREPVTRAFSRMEHWTTLKEDVSQENLRKMFDGLVFELLPRVRSCVAKYVDIYALMNCFRDPNQPLGPRYEPDFAISKPLMDSLRNLHFIEHGLYKMQIEHWHEHLQPDIDRLLIIKSEDFYADPAKWMGRVTQHLRLPPIDWSDITAVKYNVRRSEDLQRPMVEFNAEEAVETKHNINPDTERYLQEFYAPFNKELADYLGVPPLWEYPWQNGEADFLPKDDANAMRLV